MIKITRESCIDAGACYDDDRIDELIPPDGLTPREVADIADVPVSDRIWVLRQAAGASDRTLRLVACRSARRALSRVVDPDPRSVAAVDVAERYARGAATDEELRSARDAAASAAADAYYAAYYAAADTAAASASYAAYYAYYYAADEGAAHLEDLAELLQQQDDTP